MRHQPTNTTVTGRVPETEGSLKNNDLFPGQRVSMDHFICSAKGRLYDSLGKSKDQVMFQGGCLFVDHASGYIHVEHQVSISASESIEAKLKFERVCYDMGVKVQAYQSDNGVFDSAAYTKELLGTNQQVRFSGVGAKHQNGIAERGIGTIMNMARTFMLHAAI